MTIKHRILVLLAAASVAAGSLTYSASADMEVVAVIAVQTRLNDNSQLFELGADKPSLTSAFTAELAVELSDRLADEFESAQRSAELASEFSKQIFDALDERLPGEVDNFIAAAD